MTLLAELARLLRLVDPMPARVVADAQAAGRLLRRPGERDSSRAKVDPLVVLFDAVPAVRCAGRRVRLGPPGGDAVLELEIRHLGAAVRIAGLALVGARLEVRSPTGGAAVAVDGAGYFTTEVPAGPVRLLLTLPGGGTSATGWL